LETSLQPLGQDSHSNEKQQDKTHEATEPALTIEHSEEADTIAGPDDESTTAILGVPGQKQEQKTDNDTSEVISEFKAFYFIINQLSFQMNEVSKETTTSTNNNLNQTPTVPEPKKEQLDNNNSNDVKEGLNSNESNDTPEESGSKESTDAQVR
jgi:hypothetical protein